MINTVHVLNVFQTEGTERLYILSSNGCSVVENIENTNVHVSNNVSEPKIDAPLRKIIIGLW